MILALDLATTTGWALLFSDGSWESGVETFGVKRGESPGMRYIRLQVWIDKTFERMKESLEDEETVIVAYEQPHHRGGASTAILAGMVAVVHKSCAEWGFDHTTVHSSTLKKLATGNGRASKKKVKKAAEKRFGEVEDDNEADALWVMQWAADETGHSVK